MAMSGETARALSLPFTWRGLIGVEADEWSYDPAWDSEALLAARIASQGATGGARVGTKES